MGGLCSSLQLWVPGGKTENSAAGETSLPWKQEAWAGGEELGCKGRAAGPNPAAAHMLPCVSPLPRGLNLLICKVGAIVATSNCSWRQTQ